jgi:TetR/AcrR family transcriptional repressor of mexJK operon
MPSVNPSRSPPAADKAQRIIAAAREALLEKGCDGVSMDEAASRAGAAKQTVYARYVSKDALFLAVVYSIQGKMLSAVSVGGPLAIRDRLRRIARELLDLVLDPSILSLSRIALGASYWFPKLGHSIYGARIRELHEILADIIERAAKDGGLVVDDPAVAAEQFLALVRGEQHLHCLYDPSFRPSRVKIEPQIDAGLDCFMARYGAHASSSVQAG